MKIVELLNEAKFDYSLADYQKVPYDSGFEDFEDVMTKQQDAFLFDQFATCLIII